MKRNQVEKEVNKSVFLVHCFARIEKGFSGRTNRVTRTEENLLRPDRASDLRTCWAACWTKYFYEADHDSISLRNIVAKSTGLYSTAVSIEVNGFFFSAVSLLISSRPSFRLFYSKTSLINVGREVSATLA